MDPSRNRLASTAYFAQPGFSILVELSFSRIVLVEFSSSHIYKVFLSILFIRKVHDCHTRIAFMAIIRVLDYHFGHITAELKLPKVEEVKKFFIETF